MECHEAGLADCNIIKKATPSQLNLLMPIQIQQVTQDYETPPPVAGQK